MHKYLVLICSLLICVSAGAQRNGNSPYSRFGIGDINDNSFMHLRQMGGITSSFLDPYHINIVNPASFAFLSATAFDIGLRAKNTTLVDADGREASVWSGNLDYISLGFPLQNDLNQLLDRDIKPYRFGTGFTLRPVSTVAYNITSTDIDPENGSILRNYNGSGGTSKFLWSFGAKYKDWAIGTNFGYLFGNITYERNVVFQDIPWAYNDVFTNRYFMDGMTYDVGILYNKTLNKKAIEAKSGTPSNRISIGVTYSGPTNFDTDSDVSVVGVQVGTNDVRTVLDTTTLGTGRIPASLGFGATYYGAEKWIIGFDIRQSYWDNYFNDATGEAKETLRNTTSMSLGGYLRPNRKSFTSYWKRIYYRYGVYTRTEPTVVNDTQVSSYGVTFGLGMPFIFQRKISHANLGVELGKRGGNSLIEETFCRFTLGFTFNDDEWFLKRKYN